MVMSSLTTKISRNQKTLIVFLFDAFVVCLTFLLSFEFRLGQIYLDNDLLREIFINTIYIAPIQLVCFYIMGLYRGIWRFSSTPDLVRIIKGVTLAMPFSFLMLFLVQRLEGFPRSIFFIQWSLLVIGIGGGRFAYRMYRDSMFEKRNSLSSRSKKTLLIGAGHAAQLLLRDIKSDTTSDIHVIGILDDDLDKRGKILQGIKVLGAVSDISQVSKKFEITDVIITIANITKTEMSRIVTYCNDTNLKVKTIPKFGDLLSGKVQITKLRKVTPSDLLGRDQVNLNQESMSHMVKGKTIVVTGAGGSIGSELCNQLVKFKPTRVICYDISEFNLYELGFKLEKYKDFTHFEYIVGDVRDVQKIDDLFSKFCPDLVFHAAAYKHVPMMELNPLECIKVNIFGTKVIAEAANKHRLDKFVLVSTDKAVNPTNVMGTTKRIAEMICQKTQGDSKTSFEIVRFGNVLGSSGSVIPRFQKQIESGGPITVTHPDIIRYFMSIPEAAQLVIQAGALGRGGEIFVLDMGEPVKIVDLAKQMVTLAGLKLDEDIEIKFTGLRPGEKLFEELLADTEETLPTANKRVRVAKVRQPVDDLDRKIMNLLQLNESEDIRKYLNVIVPEYSIPGHDEEDKKLSYFRQEIN